MGMPELILIFVVALLVFGPKKLPELGKSLGKGLAEFKKASEDLKRTIEDEIEQGKQEAASVKQHVSEVRNTLTAAAAPIETPHAAVPAAPAAPVAPAGPEASVPRADAPIRPA
ncbi:MAG: TatA/E family twin arginine-targeting protein translocase [Acidobacteriota bacterium]